jgi:hypothetical protein
MTRTTMPSSPVGPSPRGMTLNAAVVAVVSLWPFLHYSKAFHSLLYFQDEWDLLDLWDKTGWWSWVGSTFAENFVPLFKLAWGGTILVSGGNYWALLVMLWLNHALNTYLVVRLATRFSGSLICGAFAGLVLGLAWVNYETLTWCVQWSAVMSLSFFLVGLEILSRWEETHVPALPRSGLMLAACTLASALCFSRGILTGCAFAVWALLTPQLLRSPGKRVVLVAMAMIPSILVGWWIFGHSSGNHHHVSGATGAMVKFALYYYAQSPLRALWSNETPEIPIIILLALVKTALCGAGLVFAPRRMRAVLVALWAFEIGNALLLGVGRFHTGLGATAGSRYQYGALAALLPFVAVLAHRAFALLPDWFHLRSLAATAVLLYLVYSVTLPWGILLPSWVPGRGQTLRGYLFKEPRGIEPQNFTGLPWMSNERARELVAKYHLH